MLNILFVFCAILSISAAADMEFLRSISFDSGHYFLMWNATDTEIVFEIQVKSLGWVGLGISPNGGMVGSDILIGWIDDGGGVFFQDRHATEHNVPKTDKIQDYKLLKGYKNETHTVLRFSRPLMTCDKEEDLPITGDTVRIIWAYNHVQPDIIKGETLEYHSSHRGSLSLLLKEPRYKVTEEGVKYVDFFAPNVTVPADMETLYWCKIYKMPKFDKKHQIIAFTPLIQKGNEAYVHHMLVYECYIENSEEMLEQWVDQNGAQCYSRNMPISWFACGRNEITGWAVGNRGYVLPPDTGHPFREEYGGATYFMMEFHYDNPHGKDGIVDNSGYRITITDKLRPHDAGALSLGLFLSPTMTIPPREEKFVAKSVCSKECIEKAVEPSGIKLFSVVLHAHLAGRAISIRHIRDGKELEPIAVDNNFDFNFQATRLIIPPKVVYPGDILLTDCAYNTTDRKLPTFGGFETHAEMCFAFLNYYPRTKKLNACLSQTPWETLMKAYGLEVEGLEYMVEGDLLRKDPSKRKNILEPSFKTVLKKINKDFFNKLKDIHAGDYASPVNIANLFRTFNITKPQEWKGRTVYDFVHNETVWKDEKFIEDFKNALGTDYVPICTSPGHVSLLGKDLSTLPYPVFEPYKSKEEPCIKGVP